jgi:hypothetical protein
MLSLNYENINYVMTQILKLSCASFSYVNISYVLALKKYMSYETVLLPKFSPDGTIILAKEQLHNSYTFLAMPILIFSPVQIIMTHPLDPAKCQDQDMCEKSLREDDESLDDSEDIAALESPEAWRVWKNMLLTNQPKMQEFGSQLAVYMHCMLQ